MLHCVLHFEFDRLFFQIRVFCGRFCYLQKLVTSVIIQTFVMNSKHYITTCDREKQRAMPFMCLSTKPPSYNTQAYCLMYSRSTVSSVLAASTSLQAVFNFEYLLVESVSTIARKIVRLLHILVFLRCLLFWFFDFC